MNVKSATTISVDDIRSADLDTLVVYHRLLSDLERQQAKGWRSWLPDWNQGNQTRYLLLLCETRLEDIQRTKEVREYFFQAAKQMLPPEVFQKIYTQANKKFSKPFKVIK